MGKLGPSTTIESHCPFVHPNAHNHSHTRNFSQNTHTHKTHTSQLHEDVVELEFLHYDVTHSGTVPGIDFARSLVASSNVCAVDVLLDKVCNRLKV